MLEVNRLTRNYDDFTAVDNVSFTIDKGEIVGLLGHNGAGKTTILKMISGYLEPDQGSIPVDDIDLAEQPTRVQTGAGLSARKFARVPGADGGGLPGLRRQYQGD